MNPMWRANLFGRKSMWTAFAVPLTIVVAGCAQYRPEPFSAERHAAALEERSFNDPRLGEFVALGLPRQRKGGRAWELSSLTLAALYYHPDLDVSRAKLVSARAAVITAAQIPNPTLSASATYNATMTAPTPWTVGQIVGFLIETMGRRKYRIGQAENLVEAAREDLATATWLVRGHVRTAFLSLWAAQRRLELNGRRAALQRQLVDLLQRRFSEGQASALDLTRERINLNQVSLAVRDAERQRAEARAQLATAVGVPLRALDAVSLSFGAFERAPPFRLEAGELRREALVGRSDVQALLAEYAAMQTALQLEIAKRFPNVNVGPGYTFDQGANKYNLDLSFELPIFNQNQGPIAEADARRKDAAARFDALQAQIIGAIDTAVSSYRAINQTMTTADALVATGRRRQDEVSRSLQAGDVDRSTLVTAELEVAAIEISRFDVLVQQRQALGALEDALQHPIFEPRVRLFVSETNPRGPSGSGI